MQTAGLLRFEPFELDLRAGVLRRRGIRVRLPEQSLQILLLLLEKPGVLVTREEVRLRLWPNQTVVDFDQCISAAMSRLRRALGESADNPRFIETQAKRGYRFLGAVERAGEQVPESRDAPAARYRFLEKLGEGGMGVVYHAEDLKLGRQVAVKLLPESDDDAPESELRRLEKEARIASALSHPNICTVHELVDFDGRPGIVMELLEGETLETRLRNGKLPLSDALSIAIQITSALAAAHGAGILHRDLKPGNIMLTRNGVKVLDFGLAITEEAADVPAAPRYGREEGSAPGTLHYMSPEQMRGERVDARSDIFSVGLLLYEMLSAHRPFEAGSAAALEKEPAPLAEAPAAVQSFLSRCLAKDADSRWPSAVAAHEELQRLASADFESPSPGSGRRLWWLAAAIALASVAAAAVWYAPHDRQAGLSPTRTVPLTSSPGVKAFVDFSPDGERVVFSWAGPPRKDSNNEFNIYAKSLGNGDPVQITRGMDDRLPHWSPDGGRIAFQRSVPGGHALMLISAGGADEQKIADMGIGLAWSPDGNEIAYVAPYAPQGSGGIVVRSLKTGQTRELTKPQPYSEGLVSWSPDGSRIAFTRSLSQSAQELFVVPSRGGQARQLTFDKQITEGFAWGSDSRSLVLVSHRYGGPSLWRVPADGGTPERIPSTAHHPSFPAVSRMGNRLAYSESILDSNIWQYHRISATAFEAPACLICSTVEDDSPRFSPDGRKIVFISKRTGTPELWLADADGSYPIQLTYLGGPPAGSPRWSPDGHWIVFDSSKAGSPDVFVISAQGGTPRQLTFESSADILPSWSHDGRWIYFLSDRGGQGRIWKVPFEGGPARQVTDHTGGEPLESADGKRLYYFQTRGIWTVAADGGPEEVIPELSSVTRTRAWAVRDDGVYFYQDTANQPVIRFFSFATRTLATVLTPAHPTVATAPGLDLSPDGRRLLYTQVDQRLNDLMMIENFR